MIVALFWLRWVFYLNLMIIVLQVCFIHPGTLSPEKPTQKWRTLRPQYGRRALPNNYIWYGKWENHAMCGEKNVEILNHIPCSFASLLITFTFKEGSWRNISWGMFSNFAAFMHLICVSGIVPLACITWFESWTLHWYLDKLVVMDLMWRMVT